MLLFHFQPTWLPGGFAGVDVFFVISGYLMTGIIFTGLQQQNFSLLQFYVARANRIIPALAVLCFVLLIFGFFFLTPWEYRTLGKHVGSSIGFVSNIIYWMESGYFDAASKEKWLIHTWSLSVEWQFYLLYPLLLAGLAKILPLRTIKVSLVIATVLGLLCSIVSTDLWPSASYYFLSARAWEMMLGGLAFLYPLQLKQQYKLPLEWFGLLLILLSYGLFSEDSPWPGYLAIMPVLGVFLVIQAGRENSPLTNNLVLQKVGASSYSIYLWHWPVVVLGYSFAIPHWFAVGIPLSLLAGWLSYQYVETRRFKKFSRLSDLVKVIPLYLAITAGAVGSAVFISNGTNYWLNRQPEVIRQTYQTVSKHFAESSNWGMDATGVQDLAPCRFNVDQLSTGVSNRLAQCYARHGAGVLILGDSHAIDLYGVVASRFDDAFIVGITSVGCRPHHKDPNCQYDTVKQLISANPLFRHIIYEQGGFYLLRDSHGKQGSRSMFSALQLSDKVQGIGLNTENVDKVMQYLTELSNFTAVTWLGSRIEPHITTRQILQKGCHYAFALRPGQQQPFNELDAYISSRLPANENIRYMSQNEMMNFDFTHDLMTCSDKFWDDGDHYSSAGEIRFGKRLPENFLHFN